MTQVVRIQSRICVGGPALHSILLSEGLSYARGSRYDTTLVGGGLEPGESSLEPFARSRGVKLEIIPEMRRSVQPWRDLKAIQRTAAILRARRPAVVHTHTAKAGAIGRTAARLTGVPIVVHTFHGHVFDGYFGPAKARTFLAVERALARTTDCILTVSEQLRTDLALKYAIAPIEKIRVVPLGLELDRFRAIDRSERGWFRSSLGIDPRAPLIVSAGRLVEIKRFDLLIEAFRTLAQSSEDAHLVIAGDGDAAYRAALEKLAAPLGSRIRFLGWRSDLERIYADADLLALTSDNEGTPVAVIEALAAGVPVVATDVGGVRDVLRSTCGILVERGSAASIAGAMARALQAPVEAAERDRDAVVSRYSHRRLIGDIGLLYDELLERKRSDVFARTDPKWTSAEVDRGVRC